MLVIKPTTVVSSANLMMVMEVCVATQSWVNRDSRMGLGTHPFGDPVLRIREVEVLFPSFITWGWHVRKSRTQLHRAGFRPRPPSLLMSLEGTMVLKVDL